MSLLSSYGRLEELLQLAQLRGDHEGLVEQLLARPPPAGAFRWGGGGLGGGVGVAKMVGRAVQDALKGVGG